jgi:hypothetical protein
MKASKILAVVLAFFWMSRVCAGAAAQPTAQNPPKGKEKASLIRMDLLRVQRGEAVVSKRNIFAPGTSLPAPVRADIEEPSPEAAAEQIETQGEEAQAPPVLNINLRYIGFIEYSRSSRKITALIILEGQPMAVVEGEVVWEGIRIGKISPQELEVIMPDSTTRKFSLEGE